MNDLVETKTNLPAEIADMFGDDAGQGYGNAEAGDFAIPRITILEALSPQLEDDSFEGKKGQLYNTLTGEVYDSVDVIPVEYRKHFLIWAPRSSGGGLVSVLTLEEGQNHIDDCEKNEKGELILPDGNILEETAEMYVVIVNDENEPQEAIISASKSRLTSMRKWMGIARGLKVRLSSGKIVNPPLFSHVYNVTTEKRSNDQGNWHVFHVAKSHAVSNPELYQYAKEFHSHVS